MPNSQFTPHNPLLIMHNHPHHAIVQ